VPLAVVGGLQLSQISASDGEHTCAITADRASVYCWGRNDHGQLGTGSTSGSNTARSPSPTKVAAGT
jgi:alpha-tubulin suppressor-like RCC1 family protein